MRTSASVVTIIGLAATGCATGATPVIAPGPWGGSHVSMQVTSAGARLEYDCAEGVIEEPLRPDAEGEILPSFPARYAGRVKGDQMTLLVSLTETGTQLGSFELRRGSSGVLLRCL